MFPRPFISIYSASDVPNWSSGESIDSCSSRLTALGYFGFLSNFFYSSNFSIYLSFSYFYFYSSLPPLSKTSSVRTYLSKWSISSLSSVKCDSGVSSYEPWELTSFSSPSLNSDDSGRGNRYKYIFLSLIESIRSSFSSISSLDSPNEFYSLGWNLLANFFIISSDSISSDSCRSIYLILLKMLSNSFSHLSFG